MVLYFSATGNTRFVAETLGAAMNDSVLDLLSRIRENDISAICSKKPFVICSPVYVSEMPRFLMKFLKKVPLHGNRKVYFIFTGAGYSGISSYIGKKLMQKKDMDVMGYEDVPMPQNYIVSNLFSQATEEDIKNTLARVRKEIPLIAEKIRRQFPLKPCNAPLPERVLTIPFNPVWTRLMQPTKKFYATAKCIGCGKCERICPLRNIILTNGKPHWQHSCAHCMGCIGSCPKEAIEYGSITKHKTKYHLTKFLTEHPK